jgi:hypothetical protein
MPTFRFQARWNGESGLPEDVYENILYYNVTQADASFEAIADGIVAAFSTANLHGGVDSAEVRVYSLAGGQPLYSKGYAYDQSFPTGPGEVAICLSYASSTTWDTSTKRRRGRIFIGPLIGSQSAVARPSLAVITKVMALGQALAVVGSGVGASWMIYSPTDGTSAEIQSISVDNAWDTQRRRGLSPTERTVATV